MDKKQQILNAALQLFIEEGADKTPTSRIAKAAGVATGTLFHHFKSKEDLINELYLNTKKEMTQLIFSTVSENSSLSEIFHAIWFQLMDWSIKSPFKIQFIAQFSNSPYITKITKQQVEDQHADLIIKMFVEGKEKGVFRNFPTGLLQAMTGGMMMSVANYFIQNPKDFQNKELLEEVFNAYWLCIAKEK